MDPREHPAVSAAEGFLELGARRLYGGLLDHRQKCANLFHVIAMLDLFDEAFA